MTAPQALIEFFQSEATEYLDRLGQLLTSAGDEAPDAAAFLPSARALRGSAVMTGLDGLSELAAAVERIATGLRDRALRWDRRLQRALAESLTELRTLVDRADEWTEQDAGRSRMQSVALAAVASADLASGPNDPSGPVVAIARFFPSDGAPGIVQRNPRPPVTLAQRFRTDMAAAAERIADEAAAVATGTGSLAPLASTDALRRTLVGLADAAESFGAASITALANHMALAPLTGPREWEAVQAFAQLLRRRDLTDAQLAQQVKQASTAWSARAVNEPAIVPIESLLYRGQSALARARAVRDALTVHWERGTIAEPSAHAHFEELSDLLDLAGTT